MTNRDYYFKEDFVKDDHSNNLYFTDIFEDGFLRIEHIKNISGSAVFDVLHFYTFDDNGQSVFLKEISSTFYV